MDPYCSLLTMDANITPLSALMLSRICSDECRIPSALSRGAAVGALT